MRSHETDILPGINPDVDHTPRVSGEVLPDEKGLDVILPDTQRRLRGVLYFAETREAHGQDAARKILAEFNDFDEKYPHTVNSVSAAIQLEHYLRQGETGERQTAPTRILLTHSDLLAAYGLKEALREDPSVDLIGMATSVEEAKQMTSELQPDVFITDYYLLNANGQLIPAGADVARYIQETFEKNIPVVILINKATDSALVECVEAGAYALVTNHDPVHIRETIHRVREGEITIPANDYARVTAINKERARKLQQAGNLTPREREVLGLLAAGFDNNQIKEMLNIEYQTVRSHIVNLLAKLGVHKMHQAVAKARELGLLPEQDENASLPKSY